MACDLCTSNYLVDPVADNAAFRGIRKACYHCGLRIEAIRMKHAQDAWRYGKADWYERLRRNVRRDLKRLYRKLQTPAKRMR